MIKLWLLLPIVGLDADNPWEPWYDKVFGVVVRAETEAEARQFANAIGGEENTDGEDVWLKAKYSTCEELKADGVRGVVMIDCRGA